MIAKLMSHLSTISSSIKFFGTKEGFWVIMRMVTDAMYFFVSICNCSSIPRTYEIESSIISMSFCLAFRVLARVGIVHCRIFVKRRARRVMFFRITIAMRILFTLIIRHRKGRSTHVTFYARVTTVVIAVC